MYEGIFIYSDRLSDDELTSAIEETVGEITKLNGSVSKTEKLGRRVFARPLKKRTSGHYARITFEIAPDQIRELHNRYKLTDTVFRAQIVVAEERPVPEEAAPEAEAAPAAASE